ncbi:MAG: hypothetical protein JO102_06745, partial [Elusimicrobia bacterium]|nr:hypothetical protein [Elusimicrobiota bacterium]
MRTKFRLGLSLLTAAVALLVSAPAHAAPTRMVGALGQSSEGTWYLTDLEKRDPETKTPYLYVILRKENVPNFSVAYEYKATFYSDDNWKLKSVVVHGQRFDFAKSDTQTWTPREKPDKIAGHWAWVDGAPKPTAGKKDEYEWSPEPGANPGRSATRMVGALGKASDGTWYLTDLEKRSPATKTPYLYVLFPYQATNAHPPFEVGTKYKATFYANHDKIQSVLVGGQRFDFELGDTTVWEPKELPSKDGGHWAWVNGAPDPVAGTKDIYAWKSDDTRLPPPREEVSQAPAPTGESESSGNLPLCDQPPLEKRTYRVAVNVSFVGG